MDQIRPNFAAGRCGYHRPVPPPHAPHGCDRWAPDARDPRQFSTHLEKSNQQPLGIRHDEARDTVAFSRWLERVNREEPARPMVAGRREADGIARAATPMSPEPPAAASKPRLSQVAAMPASAAQVIAAYQPPRTIVRGRFDVMG